PSSCRTSPLASRAAPADDGRMPGIASSPGAADQARQLAQAEDWERLADLLADPAVLSAIEAQDPLALRAWWARIEERTSRRMVDAYRAVVEGDGDHPAAWNVALFLHRMGHRREAAALQERLLARARGDGRPETIAAALGNLAASLTELGE